MVASYCETLTRSDKTLQLLVQRTDAHVLLLQLVVGSARFGKIAVLREASSVQGLGCGGQQELQGLLCRRQ